MGPFGLSGGQAAFTSAYTSDGSGGQYDIHLFDGSVTQFISSSRIGSLPSIFGSVITWTSSHSFDFTELEAFVYDGTNVRQVSDTGNVFLSLASGSRAIWKGEGVDLFAYDVDSQITSLLRNDPDETGVSDFDGDRALYLAQEGGRRELFVYDFNTQLATQLTVNGTSGFRSDLHGNSVVWEDFDGTDWEIFLHDLVTGQTIQLNDNLLDDRNPHESDSMIVWQTFDGNDWEIFQYSTAVPEPTSSALAVLAVALGTVLGRERPPLAAAAANIRSLSLNDIGGPAQRI